MANKGRLTTGIFCLFLAGLLAWHIALPDRARSETENRTLAQFPDFSWETLKNATYYMKHYHLLHFGTFFLQIVYDVAKK